MMARWLRRLADRIDGGQARPPIIINADDLVDPHATAREIQRVLLNYKRRSGGSRGLA